MILSELVPTHKLMTWWRERTQRMVPDDYLAKCYRRTDNELPAGSAR